MSEDTATATSANPNEKRIREIMECERAAHKVRFGSKTEQNKSRDLRMTQEQKKMTFTLFDTDETGSIATCDLPLLLRSVGMELDDQTVAQLQDDYEKEPHSGMITFEEFDGITKQLRTPMDSEDEAKRIFGQIDLGNTGKIDKASLREALIACDARVSDNEIAEVFKYCDLDGDGALSMEEYLTVIQFVNEVEA